MSAPQPAAHRFLRLRRRIRRWYRQIKELRGDPDYVAKGMAIGIFVAFTPIIPFHTIVAVALSFVLRGSKAAAVIGVWFSNPLTIPPLYWASYKIGGLLVPGARIPANPSMSLPQIFALGLEISTAAVLGGILLGILPAAAAYGITRKLMTLDR